MNKIKVMMLSKKSNIFCDYAEVLLRSYFESDEILSIRGDAGKNLDDELYWYQPEYVISFLSPWIIPQSILSSAQKAAINFHPGSPDYPGIGCYNFALYEDCKRYGVTVHHMNEKVNTGDIVLTSYFDIAPFETVETLSLKSMNHLLLCFEKILSFIVADTPLPMSNESWNRKPFTRKQMYELFEIIPLVHDKKEIEKRIRASKHSGGKGAFVSIDGCKFYYEEREPVVE